MRKGIATIGLTVSMLLFTGAGCLDSDVDLLLGFVSSWLQQRGVIDKNGNPTANTVKYVGSGGWISSGDKDNDALIDGGLVAKSVKEADEAVDSAQNNAARGKFDEANATLNAQLAKRPNDHHVRNAKGAVLLKQGRGDEAKGYLASTSTCDTSSGNVRPADYDRCKRMLRDENQQLKDTGPYYGIERAPLAADSTECKQVRQRVLTLIRLEDIARLQSRFDEADGYTQQRINLEGSTPTCRK